MAVRRRKRRRRRVPREMMTPEEIRRAKKRARRRKKERAKKRFYTVLFLALVLFAAIFLIKLRKPAGESVSENGMPAAGAAAQDHTEGYNGSAGGEASDESYVPQDLTGVIDLSVPLDVTKGKAAFSMDTVSGDAALELSQAKAAMAQAAYFTGDSTPLNTYLASYGEGSWHAIRTEDNEIVAFYEGVHKEKDASEEDSKKKKKKDDSDDEDGEEDVKTVDVPFKVTFLVYEDGSFYVQSVEEDESIVEDYETWLYKRVKGDDAVPEDDTTPLPDTSVWPAGSPSQNVVSENQAAGETAGAAQDSADAEDAAQ